MSGFGWLIQGSIQAKAGDHADRILQLAESPKQFDYRKTAVCHHH
jgi:hypothetical protein